jgi:hypothetical protein
LRVAQLQAGSFDWVALKAERDTGLHEPGT